MQINRRLETLYRRKEIPEYSLKDIEGEEDIELIHIIDYYLNQILSQKIDIEKELFINLKQLNYKIKEYFPTLFQIDYELLNGGISQKKKNLHTKLFKFCLKLFDLINGELNKIELNDEMADKVILQVCFF